MADLVALCDATPGTTLTTKSVFGRWTNQMGSLHAVDKASLRSALAAVSTSDAVLETDEMTQVVAGPTDSSSPMVQVTCG